MISPDRLHYLQLHLFSLKRPSNPSNAAPSSSTTIHFLPSCYTDFELSVSLLDEVWSLHSSPHAQRLATIVILQRRLQLDAFSLMLHRQQPGSAALLSMLKECIFIYSFSL